MTNVPWVQGTWTTNVTTGTYYNASNFIINAPIYNGPLPRAAPRPPTDDGPRPTDLGEDMHEEITPELEKGLRGWNAHPGNAGRYLTGSHPMPYDDAAIRRAIKRWNEGNGSFLVEQFLRDLKSGHRTIIAVVPPPDEPSEKIPANDPRLMMMWAKIAKNAATRGTTGHYDIISREVGAPTFKQLEEEEYLWAENLVIYTMSNIAVSVKTDPGQRRPQSLVTGGMIRAAVLKVLEDSTDEQLLERLSFYDSRSDWILGNGKAAPEAEEAGTDGEHEPGSGGADRDGSVGGSGVSADGRADAGADDAAGVERVAERVG